MQIRNIAIIAHVDHGKTTLVDAILKQTDTFRENQKEMSQTLIMDSNDLEREKGITILAKNTSVFYKDTKINIIDTPGHSDFGGEVERTINMASGALLLVDAVEGVLPQTKFVLKKALEAKLKIILVINKIDKKDARAQEVINEVENLFLELADNESHLHFKTIYAVGRDGKAYLELPETYTQETPGNLAPLFDTILDEVPNAVLSEDKPFQMLVSTLDYDNYVGRLCIGKVEQGTLVKNQSISVVDEGRVLGTYQVQKIYTTQGLKKQEVDEIQAGDIATVAGIPELTIGQTLCDPANPYSLPKIEIEEPTIKITLGPNTSPFNGREGKFKTSRQLKERLMKEKETNLGLRIEEDPGSVNFIVSGRGELHLAVLIENMRREGYEMEVSKPQVIYKTVNGAVCEPYEEITIETDEEFFGLISEEMGKRRAEMIDMKNEQSGRVEAVYKASSRNLLGLRNALLTKTRGTVQINSYFLGFEKKSTKMESLRSGALIAVKDGKTVSYGLANAQARGILFVGTDVNVYEGMVVGLAAKSNDVEVNICKTKQLTNNRSSGEGVSVQVSPPTILSLEQYLDFIGDDELLEVTPLNLRARKRYLSVTERRIMSGLRVSTGICFPARGPRLSRKAGLVGSLAVTVTA